MKHCEHCNSAFEPVLETVCEKCFSEFQDHRDAFVSKLQRELDEARAFIEKWQKPAPTQIDVLGLDVVRDREIYYYQQLAERDEQIKNLREALEFYSKMNVAEDFYQRDDFGDLAREVLTKWSGK